MQEIFILVYGGSVYIGRPQCFGACGKVGHHAREHIIEHAGLTTTRKQRQRKGQGFNTLFKSTPLVT